MNHFYNLRSVLLLVVATCFSASGYSAVHLSQSGTGQAISLPFYSVSPQINTTVTINNHTDQFKAVKIHLKESKNLTTLKSFNLYLQPQDMWTMAMFSIDDEMYIVTGDVGSCATEVNLAGDLADLRVNLPAELDWWEWQTGTIEAIEMGEINPSIAADLFQDTVNPCDGVYAAWSFGGHWYDDAGVGLTAATGGISGSISMIDVTNGFAYSYSPLIFDGFFGADSINHTLPRTAEPNLASGTRESLVFNEGQAVHTLWPTGYEAISALLMTTHIENNLELDESIDAVTEWVISFPTLGYHKNGINSTAPFEFIGETVSFPAAFKFPPYPTIYGPDSEVINTADFGCTPTVPCSFSKTSAVTTFSLVNRSDSAPEYSILAGIYQSRSGYSDRKNHELIRIGERGNTQRTDNGKVSFSIYKKNGSYFSQFSTPNERGLDAVTNEPHIYYGLPAAGFSLTRYTNANAQPGQLAVYAKSHAHLRRVIIDKLND